MANAEDDFLYKEETYKIRGACFKIWNTFGGAFKENIVDRALTEELVKLGLKVESQKRIDVYYEGKKVGVYIPDKIVDDSVLLELKCKPFVTLEDRKQFWYYLKASPYRIGLLVNFGPKRLTVYRRIYDRARKHLRESA